MAKISANGATEVARVTRLRDNATDTLVLCSDGRILVKTDVRHTSIGSVPYTSHGTYRVLTKFSPQIVKDQNGRDKLGSGHPRMAAAFYRYAARMNYPVPA